MTTSHYVTKAQGASLTSRHSMGRGAAVLESPERRRQFKKPRRKVPEIKTTLREGEYKKAAGPRGLANDRTRIRRNGSLSTFAREQGDLPFGGFRNVTAKPKANEWSSAVCWRFLNISIQYLNIFVQERNSLQLFRK